MNVFSSTNLNLYASSYAQVDGLLGSAANTGVGNTALLGSNFSSAPITAPLNSLQAATTLFGPDVSSAPITAPLNMFEASMLYPNSQNVVSPALDVSDDMDVPVPDINDPDDAASQSPDAVLNYFEKKNNDEQNAEIQSAPSQALRSAVKSTTVAIKITGVLEASIFVGTHMRVMANSIGVLFIYPEVGIKQTIIVKSASDGKSYDLLLDIKNDRINITKNGLPLGSWLKLFSPRSSGVREIHVATKTEASLAVRSYNWVKNNPYLNYLISSGNPYAKWVWDTINYYFNTAINGAKLLPQLVSYVSVASAYSKSTFWGAMNRLVLFKRFQSIEAQIKREANWQYKSANVFLDAKASGGQKLTFGTAALAGFLLRIHEITTMGGLNVKTAAGKFVTKNKSFVDFIRQEIFLLGKTLNTKSYTGNKKDVIQTSVRRAAASGNIHHLFDGKDDPVFSQGKIQDRRRELQEERDLEWPDFPWTNPDLVENRQFYLNVLLRIARNDGYAAAMNRAFETVLDRGRRNDALNVATTNEILQTVRQDIENYDFGQLVINMLLNVPGTFFQLREPDGQGRWILQTALPELEDAFTNNGAQVGDATRRVLNNYRDVQNAANLAAVRAIFAPAGVIYDTYGWTRTRRLTVAPITDIMQILNTLLIGGTQLQPGANFTAANGVFERARAAYQATMPLGMIDPRFDIVGLNVWAYKGN